MSTHSVDSLNTRENSRTSEPLTDLGVHHCSNCSLKFETLSDLELHSQLHDKKNDFKCSLCNDVFTDFEQFKLHDLRHSLEEAEEDVTDIERMILPFGLKSCDICGEKFSCDEELINHSMNHPEPVEGGISSEKCSYDELMNYSGDILPEANLITSKEDCDYEDGETSYQILRQEIVTDKSGRTDVHFVLIDHQNEQVDEYTHTIHHQVEPAVKKTKKRPANKRNGNIVKPINNRPRRRKPEDEVVYIKSVNAPTKKCIKSENDVVKEERKSDDEIVCLDDNEFDDKSRRCKQIALKRKLWNEKVYLPPAQKLKDCPTCNKSFGDLQNFKKHLLTHKSETEDVIYDVRKTKTSFKVEKDENSENDYPDWIEIICELCYTNFCRKKGLRRHLINVHKLDLEKVDFYLSKVKYNTATYYTCKTCKKKFYRESRLHSHDCTPAIAVVCELCSLKLSSKSVLKKHLLTSHKLGEIKTNAIMEQLANYNAKFYKKLDPIGEVAVSSSDGRLITKSKGTKLNIFEGFRCDKCNKDISEESEGHRCWSKIQIKCEVCKYIAPSKYNLKRHLICIHKLLPGDAEKVINEFKYYNERLKLRHATAKKKRYSINRSRGTNKKRPALRRATPSKKVANTKTNSVVLSKTSNFKTIKDIKTRAKEILLNKSKKLLLSENEEVKKNLTKYSLSPQKANLPGHSLSKKPNVSSIAKKREKMKYTSPDSIKVAAKRPVAKSSNILGRKVTVRVLRSNKK